MMGWAKQYIEKLKAGETVQFRPRGHSMHPIVSDRQLVTVEPVQDKGILKKGDVVLCVVGTNHFLHLIKDVRKDDQGRLNFLIGNNRGGVNGGCPEHHVYGVLTRVEK